MNKEQLACETPIEDLLRGVPIGHRLEIEVGPCHHHMIPVGTHCHRAADAIQTLRAEVVHMQKSKCAPGCAWYEEGDKQRKEIKLLRSQLRETEKQLRVAREVATVIVEEAVNKGFADFQHPSWNPDAHVGITLTIKEVRKAKQVLTGVGLSVHPEATCLKCGGPNVTWFAPSGLWNKYHGEYNILCPVCFIKLAEEKGCVPTSWKLGPEQINKLTATGGEGEK